MIYNMPPRWTWLMLRSYALAYLGVERLPKGLTDELRAYLGAYAYRPSVDAILKRYYRRPWLS